MPVTKIEYAYSKNLDPGFRKRHKIKDGEFVEIRTVNPEKGVVVRKIKTPTDEIRNHIRKKGLNGLKLE